MTDPIAPDEPRTALPNLVHSKGWLFALGLVALGLFLRLDETLGYWVNPDEGINYSIITQDTLAGCWLELVSNTHPPLISIVLAALSLVSFDPTWFRMASLLPGCAAIFGAYLAGREIGGERGSTCNFAGLVSAAVVAISPFAIDQSRVIRPYMLQFALLSYAIWGLARWLRQASATVPDPENPPRGPQGPRGLAWFSVCASLAILAQFSSFFVVGACGLLLLGMLVRGHLARAHWKPLALAFVAPCAVMALLFAVHIGPHLMGTSIQATAQASWLKSAMGFDLAQLGRNIVGLHLYLFGVKAGYGTLVAIGIAGIVGLMRRRTATWLALAVLAITLVASLASLYPFGGSRHSGYLLLFLALAIGDIAGLLAATRPILLGLAAVVLGGLIALGDWITATTGSDFRFPIEVILSGEDWHKASRSLQTMRSHDGVLFTNLQSYYCLYPELRQHWDRPSRRFMTIAEGEGKTEGENKKVIGRSFRMGECEVFVNEDWGMTIHPSQIDQPKNLYRFIRLTDELRPELRLRDRRTVWVVNAGWALKVMSDLKANAEKLQNEHGMKLIHQLEEYPGIFICELDLRVFMKVFGSFAKDK